MSYFVAGGGFILAERGVVLLNAEATAYEQVTRQMVEDLGERFDKHEEKQNSTLEKIEKRLEQIEQKLNGRPTWAVSVLVTFLSSLCVGMAVYLVGR